MNKPLDLHEFVQKKGLLDLIARVMDVDAEQITDIQPLKAGMTNRSFIFRCAGKRYIMRVPGEGTDRLINRRQEAAVYKAIDGLHLSDNVVYIDPSTGYKITEFLENTHNCDPRSAPEVRACMDKLRRFHGMGLKVDHRFEIFEQIEYYESLRQGVPSKYKDYEQIKKQVFALKDYIDRHVQEQVLTHIDAVPDNFLMTEDPDGSKHIRLIDWEYSGMQDPHVDIAMFGIYAMYDKRHIDRLIRYYFPEGCSNAVRTKIYCYVAACGLLWSNWCEFKRFLGVEFGAYADRQYWYAKRFLKHARKSIEKE